MDAINEHEEVSDEKSRETFMRLIHLHYRTSHIREKRRSLHLNEGNSKKEMQNSGQHELSNNDLASNNKNTVQNIAPFSEIYSVLMETHIKNNHQITDAFKAEVNFAIPSICYDIIPKVCSTCCREIGAEAPRNGLVSFLHRMAKRGKPQLFDAALIYFDEFSEYTVVRPILSANNLIDVTMEIFKIFMEFGPPDKVNFNLEPTTEVLHNFLHTMIPECEVIFQPQFHINSLTSRVLEALVSWMEENASDSWEVGCAFVQHHLNKKLKPGGTSVTAHDLFFNLKTCKIEIETINSTSKKETGAFNIANISRLKINDDDDDTTGEATEEYNTEDDENEDKIDLETDDD